MGNLPGPMDLVAGFVVSVIATATGAGFLGGLTGGLLAAPQSWRWRGAGPDGCPHGHGGWYGTPGAYWVHCARVIVSPVNAQSWSAAAAGSVSRR